MKKYLEHIIPAIVIIFLIAVFAMFVGTKVHAKTMEAAIREQRENMESTYITAVKSELQANGFMNSGVNMTKATNETGEWEYTVFIYHRSFEWMEADDKVALEKELEVLGSESLGKISLRLVAR